MRREPRITGLRRVFRLPGTGRTIDRDINDEVRFHIESRVDALVARGTSPRDAREIADREFGDVGAARAELAVVDKRILMRDRQAAWWSALGRDLRYALRGLRQHPAFSLGVVLTMALGIGANSAVFRLVDRLLLRMPAKVAAPEQLRRVGFDLVTKQGQRLPYSSLWYGEYEALRQLTAFHGIAAYSGVQGMASGPGRSVMGSFVSDGYFEMLGVTPASGRFFTEDELRPGSGIKSIIVSFSYWQHTLAGDQAALGKQVETSYGAYEIVGVAPRNFSGIDVDPVELWLPMGAMNPGSSTSRGVTVPWYRSPSYRMVQVVARLASGVAPEAATAQTATALQGGQADADRAGKIDGVALTSIIAPRNGTRYKNEVAILVRLAGVALLMLIITSANIANLLLTRALRRRREIAVRLALGISRGRLVRQLLVEGGTLALVGGAAALVVGYWTAGVLRTLLFPFAFWDTAPADSRVMLFTTAIALLCGLAASLAPAMQTTNPHLTEALASGRVATRRRVHLTRTGLIVGQAALSVMLLVGAGLFVRSLRKLSEIDLGLRPAGLLEVEVARPGAPSRMARSAEAPPVDPAVEDFVARIKTIPDVVDVALIAPSPYWGTASLSLAIPGHGVLPFADLGGPYISEVSSDFFRTIGMNIVRGRGFTATDTKSSERVLVVNETMARTYWPGADPVGSCLNITGSRTCTRVVGIARDFQTAHLTGPVPMQFFVPLAQENGAGGFGSTGALFVRVGRVPMTATVQSLAQKMFPPGFNGFVGLVAPRYDAHLRPFRIGTVTLALFGALALALAAIGLYGVVSFTFAERTHEFGVRVALGATSTSLVSLVLRSAARLVIGGVVVGTVLSLLARRFVATLLYGVSPADPLAIGVAALVSIAVCLAAAYVPARRAARVDPVIALRAE